MKLQNALSLCLETDWLRLVELMKSDAKALGALSRPDPGMLVHLRREAIKIGGGTPEALAEEDAYQLGQRMIENFRALGGSGQIIGLGIYSGTGLRQTIPPELWSTLKFDFEAEEASGKGFSYTHLTIEEAVPTGAHVDIVARIAAWLTQQRTDNGAAAKKILAADARAKFGGEYTERVFNEAYKEVYQRQKGRPREPEK